MACKVFALGSGDRPKEQNFDFARLVAVVKIKPNPYLWGSQFLSKDFLWACVSLCFKSFIENQLVHSFVCWQQNYHIQTFIGVFATSPKASQEIWALLSVEASAAKLFLQTLWGGGINRLKQQGSLGSPMRAGLEWCPKRQWSLFKECETKDQRGYETPTSADFNWIHCSWRTTSSTPLRMASSIPTWSSNFVAFCRSVKVLIWGSQEPLKEALQGSGFYSVLSPSNGLPGDNLEALVFIIQQILAKMRQGENFAFLCFSKGSWIFSILYTYYTQ